MSKPGVSPEQQHVLACLEKTFKVGWLPGASCLWGCMCAAPGGSRQRSAAAATGAGALAQLCTSGHAAPHRARRRTCAPTPAWRATRPRSTAWRPSCSKRATGWSWALRTRRCPAPGGAAGAGCHSLGSGKAQTAAVPKTPQPREPAPQGAFHKASSVQLRNKMRTDDDEAVRQACYDGLRSIGPAVAGARAGVRGEQRLGGLVALLELPPLLPRSCCAFLPPPCLSLCLAVQRHKVLPPANTLCCHACSHCPTTRLAAQSGLPRL